METKTADNRSGAPGWWRAAAAAKLAGLTPEMLIQAAKAGQIPVRCQAFGQRGIQHIHVREFLAWMESQTPEAGKMTPASTAALARALRDLRTTATWADAPDTLAVIDSIALARAGVALRTWAADNATHDGAAAAGALAALVAACADMPAWNSAHDIRDALRAGCRLVQLAGKVPASNDQPRAVLATISNRSTTPAAARPPRR